MRTIGLTLILMLLTACAPTLKPEISLHKPISEAVSYLRSEVNQDLFLIRESPESFPDRHWLATDNWLAAHALAAAGEDELAAQIIEALDRYNGGPHGLIEALAGAPIEWPPRTATQFQLDSVRQGVWMEERTSGAVMEDWYDYVDLRMYGAIRAIQRGEIENARAYYQATVDEFQADGHGFQDRAFDERYATYKLALTLYVGTLLGEQTEETMLQALLAKQADSGGFTTHYNSDGQPIGDTNTETTAYALLALSALVGQQRSAFLYFIPAFLLAGIASIFQHRARRHLRQDAPLTRWQRRLYVNRLPYGYYTPQGKRYIRMTGYFILAGLLYFAIVFAAVVFLF